MRAEVCRQTLQCLADPERTRAVCTAAAEIAPAWKTGTSSGRRDAWCAAVTPRRTVVVWLGNADGSGSDRLVGQEAAAPLALQILAAEDRVKGDGFAPPPRFAMARADDPHSFVTEPVSLAMLSPTSGQEIVHDPALPSEQQRFPLRARSVGSEADAELWWFVDGECVAHGHGGQPLWWTPIAGVHEVRVVDRDGHVIKVQVRVRDGT